MSEIILSTGAIVLVDEQDFEFLDQWKWYQHNCGYAVRKPWKTKKAIYMHRLIIPCPDGCEIDHINGNKLDNRRCNLRAVSHAVNLQNRPKQKNNTTGYKGVFFDRRRDMWWSMKVMNKKRIWLGYFKTPEDASRAYESR